MIKGVVVPALGSDGWVSTTGKALDKLMSYFLESDKSQSYSYYDNIVSLSYIYTENAADPSRMAVVLASELTAYLERYFKRADVSCEGTNENNDPNKVYLTLSVSVIDEEGMPYDLTRVIKGTKSKITEIVNHLNG